MMTLVSVLVTMTLRVITGLEQALRILCTLSSCTCFCRLYRADDDSFAPLQVSIACQRNMLQNKPQIRSLRHPFFLMRGRDGRLHSLPRRFGLARLIKAKYEQSSANDRRTCTRCDDTARLRDKCGETPRTLTRIHGAPPLIRHFSRDPINALSLGAL